MLAVAKDIRDIFQGAWDIFSIYAEDPIRQIQEKDAGEIAVEIEEKRELERRFLDIERKRAELEEEKNSIEESRLAVQKVEIKLEGAKVLEDFDKEIFKEEIETLKKEREEFERFRDNHQGEKKPKKGLFR